MSSYVPVTPAQIVSYSVHWDGAGGDPFVALFRSWKVEGSINFIQLYYTNTKEIRCNDVGAWFLLAGSMHCSGTIPCDEHYNRNLNLSRLGNFHFLWKNKNINTNVKTTPMDWIVASTRAELNLAKHNSDWSDWNSDASQTTQAGWI